MAGERTESLRIGLAVTVAVAMTAGHAEAFAFTLAGPDPAVDPVADDEAAPFVALFMAAGR
ncbi:extracellular calcium-sensing receptor, partial [Corchorus capsularis]